MYDFFVSSLLQLCGCSWRRSTWQPSGAFSWWNGFCSSSRTYSCAATI